MYLSDTPLSMLKRSKRAFSDMIGLVWFYGTSIIVGYLMLNSVYTYILDEYNL